MKIPEKPPKIDKILAGENSRIFALLEDKEVRRSIIEYNRRYVHWDELKYKKLPKDLKPEHLWVLLKIFRQQQYRVLKFGGWTYSYALLDETLRKLHRLDKGAAGHLESGLAAFNTEGREKYIISSLMEEAIASSQLEGAATTRKNAKEMLRLRKKPASYSEQMIVNGYNTMERIVKMRDKTITPEIILEIQREITKDTLKDKQDEGRFRDNNDVVVGDPLEVAKVYHRPPDYKRIPELMEEFCRFASDDEHTFIHPVVKGIMLHFLIGFIHPFNDGNGRTARSIFYWYLLSRGYWLLEFMSVSRILIRSKRKYGLAYLYTETDGNDLTYFLNYNMSAIDEALDAMEEYISRKQREQIEAMKLVEGAADMNLRQAEILKDFMKNPGKPYSIKEVMTTYGVAYDTARNDLLHLAKKGRIKKSKAKKKFIYRLSAGRT